MADELDGSLGELLGTTRLWFGVGGKKGTCWPAAADGAAAAGR